VGNLKNKIRALITRSQMGISEYKHNNWRI